MGRHHRPAGNTELTELTALLAGWHAGLATPPAPRAPACPQCWSVKTVSHGKQAHCGDCGSEWEVVVTERERFEARRLIDRRADQ
jgi:hypothetical protein